MEEQKAYADMTDEELRKFIDHWLREVMMHKSSLAYENVFNASNELNKRRHTNG